ncbi:MAG: hypothetical protein LBV16_08845 [Elusimicrobiota bacterium]|jgi:hypothetical protein|nr:hypothetical protein [Elusimicrobiota bacterium]
MTKLTPPSPSSPSIVVDIVFIIAFLILLLIPISNINISGKISQENRNLAEYKSIITRNGNINYEYGKNFEQWFNDRFYGRNQAIKYYYKLVNKTNDKVLFGKDNWLFFRVDRSIQNYQNIFLFSDGELKTAASYLQELNDFAVSNNKKFYFFIVPDKHRIYPEYYPDHIKKNIPDEQSMTSQLVTYLRKNTAVNVIYPYQSLYQHKKDGLLYWKQDTHWNPLGAYWGYRTLMDEISKDFNIKPLILDETIMPDYYDNDLYYMLPAKSRRDDEAQFYKIPKMKMNFTHLII